MAQTRIVIAGTGLVSPLGHSAWQTFTALLAGRILADRAAALPEDVAPVDLVRALGSVSIAQHTAADPAIELAERAAREALFEAGIDPQATEVQGFLGTSKGAVVELAAAMKALESACGSSPIEGGRRSVKAQVVCLGPHGYLANQLQRRLNVPMIGHTVAACASSLMALHQARMHLLHDPAASEAALVLTSEAALTPLFIHSYRRLGVLAPLTAETYRARPLDQQRGGFMLSELAAAVVLKRVDRVGEGEVELVDTAVGSESYDMVRPAEQMGALQRLAGRLLAGRAIDVLHPHAPGTVDHDAAEVAALAAALASVDDGRKSAVELYACKGALGHGLGAAGLVSLVLACLMARTGRRPAMPWLTEPIPVGPTMSLSASPPPARPLPTHGIVAAGFAGHLAGAIIHRRSSADAASSSTGEKG